MSTVDFSFASNFCISDWLKKIYADFHYRIVVLNDRDLARCGVPAYSPVVIELDQSACAFLAIPDESVRIGHILIHQTSAYRV